MKLGRLSGYIITDRFVDCSSIRYRVLYRPRHCDLVTQDGDDVTMVMEYWGAKGGRGAEVERAVALRLGKGQTINDVQVVFLTSMLYLLFIFTMFGLSTLDIWL